MPPLPVPFHLLQHQLPPAQGGMDNAGASAVWVPGPGTKDRQEQGVGELFQGGAAGRGGAGRALPRGVLALCPSLPTLPLHVDAVPGDGAAGGTLDVDGGDKLVLIDQPVLDHLG